MLNRLRSLITMPRNSRRRVRPFVMPPAEVLEPRQLLAAAALTRIKYPEFEADNPTLRGAGWAIAVIDAGFDKDNPSFGPDLITNTNEGGGVAPGDTVGDRIKYRWDYADMNIDVDSPPSADPFWTRGTAIASLAAGTNRSTENPLLRGIAPDADLMLFKVAKDNSPTIEQTAVLAALDWIIANAESRKIAAVTLPVNLAATSTTIDNVSQAAFLQDYSLRLRSLEEIGVIAVVGAGNEYGRDADSSTGGDQQLPPGLSKLAAAEHTVAVGAITDSSVSENGGQWVQLANQQAYLSQRHQRLLDVLAPGVDMVAAAVNGPTTVDGTEYAAALVAGAAVLAQQQAHQELGRRLTTSEFVSTLRKSTPFLLDANATEGTTDAFNVTNILVSFPVLDVQKLIADVKSIASTKPRAVATAPILQINQASDSSRRRATLAWEASPDATIYDVWVHGVNAAANGQGSGGAAWSTLYNPATGTGGIAGTSVTADWPASSVHPDIYLWWVRARNVSDGTLGEWSIQRRLYFVNDVTTPGTPVFTAPVVQALDKVDINFTPVPNAAVYHIEVDRVGTFFIQSGKNKFAGPITRGFLPGQVISGPGIPTGTVFYDVTTHLPDATPAPDWVPNASYSPSTTFRVTIPTDSNYYADFLGRPLRNGQAYNLRYNNTTTSAPSLSPFEITRMSTSTSVQGETVVHVSNVATETDLAGEIAVNVISAGDSVRSRIRPRADFLAADYRTQARSINHQNEASAWSSYARFTVADQLYPNPVYLGSPKISVNHNFVWSDTNPIGHYRVEVTIGSTVLQETTTENKLTLNTPLPLGTGTLRVFSVSEFGSTTSSATAYPIEVLSTVMAPAVPVYTGPTTFNGVVNLAWTVSAEANYTTVLVKNTQTQASIPWLTNKTVFGTSLLANELESGSYSLQLRSFNSAGVASDFTAVIPFTIARTAIAVTPPTVSTVSGLPSSVRRIDWTVSSSAKYYEVWIGRDGAAASNTDFLMVSALVKDENTFYVSLPAGSYRVWLRAWSHEDSNSYGSGWSAGVPFTVS